MYRHYRLPMKCEGINAFLVLEESFWEEIYFSSGSSNGLGSNKTLNHSILPFSTWYQPLLKEISDTWERMPSNILGVPVFALLIWLHGPLWRYFADLIRSLAKDLHRHIVVAAIAAVSFGYLIMFAIVFDYSRWISNWAVCMFLILHAVKALPASRAVPLISTEDRKTRLLGWIVTLIPRVGIVRPF